MTEDRAISLKEAMEVIDVRYLDSGLKDCIRQKLMELPSVGRDTNVSTLDYISRQAVFAQLVAGLEVAE